MSVPRLLLLSVSLAAVALASPAHAQRQQQERGERAEGGSAQQAPQGRGQQARGQDSMADSIRRVRGANRGQVLSAERMHSDGREINRIKMVDDRGRVRVFEDDPQQHQRQPQRQRSRGDDD